MRVPIIGLALLVPFPALAGYVIHPTPGDPNPPLIVATSGKFSSSTTFVLDRFGHAWEYVPVGWARRVIDDPPMPLSEVMYWEEGGVITTSGDLWHWAGDHWENHGPPPSFAGADETAAAFRGLRAAPNPSADFSRITFTLTSAGHVSVRIFDATGRLVRTVLEGDLPAGEAAVEWDGRTDDGQSVAPGIYFSRVETGAGVMSGRVVRQ